jgi:4-oxalocrotonate tautomerase
MPLVQIKGVGGYLTLEQKQEMIRRVTDAVLSIEGEGLRQVTWVTIEDVQPGAWCVGGQPVTDDDLRSLAQMRAAE